MSKVVYNPTDEDFEVMFQGIPIKIQGVRFDEGKNIIEDGAKIKMDDARANHCLNELAPRGLVQLEYGDESRVDEIREAGRRRNIEFKQRQVGRYNQDNESRRQTNRQYVPATPQVQRYADELGLRLIKPFEIEDPSKSENVRLQKENEQLKTALDKQSRQIDMILKKLNEGTTPSAEDTKDIQDLPDDEVELKHCMEEFKMMNRAVFAPWVKENRERWERWPMEAQNEIRRKWDNFYDEKFPF